MSAYRFRVKLEWDPTSLWRDIVVGEDRTLAEFQTVINETMGLNQEHLWFFGADQDYWQSSVKYQRPEEYENLPSGESMRWDETVHNAGETTIAELASQLDLEVGDRICHLFDYGDEWRFYGILKEIRENDASDTKPKVIHEKGEPVVQYPIDEDPRYR